MLVHQRVCLAYPRCLFFGGFAGGKDSRKAGNLEKLLCLFWVVLVL